MKAQFWIEKATSYLDLLESERRAAIATSEQKAEEAKLIKARQEGFQAAIDLYRKELSIAGSELSTDQPARRRRNIPELIMRELSFSGKAMSTPQIAKAIDYIPERTETALKRLSNAGKILRNEYDKWTVVVSDVERFNEHTAGAEGDLLPGRPLRNGVESLVIPARGARKMESGTLRSTA
jgi:hypothetical protein